MKVILLQDVSKIGKKFELKDVSDGYARNFLLKNKLAEFATPEAIQKIDRIKHKVEEDRRAKEDAVEKKINSLSESGLVVEAKSNEEGKLFAGVRKEDVLIAMKNAGIEIEDDYVIFEKPVKEAGEIDLPIRVGRKNFKVKLNIKAVK